MGAPKGGGYQQLPSQSPQQSDFLNQLLSGQNPQIQQASQGFQQFLPGGGGGEAIAKAAQNRYTQQTVPQILQQLGSGNKGSSGLNQALASSASDLQTNLGSQLAQMQLQASQGLGGLGLGTAQVGLGTSTFDNVQRQPPLWQQILLTTLGTLSEAGRGVGKATMGGGF